MADLYPDLRIVDELRPHMSGRSDHEIKAMAVAYMLSWIPRSAADHRTECNLGGACQTCRNFTLALSLMAAFVAEHPPIPGLPENLFDV